MSRRDDDTARQTGQESDEREPVTPFDRAYASETPLFGEQESPELGSLLDARSMEGEALDLGCGDGRETLHLLRRGLKVTAVDLSRVGLQKLERLARARGILSEHLETIHADVQAWPIPPDRYRLIVGATILDHVASEEAPAFAGRMIRGLAPGGLLFVTVHTVEDAAVTHSAPASEFASQVRHYYGPNELLRLFVEHLRILRYEERVEWDDKHGLPHQHGYASLLGER